MQSFPDTEPGSFPMPLSAMDHCYGLPESLCGCVEIGRQARLRIWCLRRMGSSPFTRTKLRRSLTGAPSSCPGYDRASRAVEGTPLRFIPQTPCVVALRSPSIKKGRAFAGIGVAGQDAKCRRSAKKDWTGDTFLLPEPIRVAGEAEKTDLGHLETRTATLCFWTCNVSSPNPQYFKCRECMLLARLFFAKKSCIIIKLIIYLQKRLK